MLHLIINISIYQVFEDPDIHHSPHYPHIHVNLIQINQAYIRILIRNTLHSTICTYRGASMITILCILDIMTKNKTIVRSILVHMMKLKRSPFR